MSVEETLVINICVYMAPPRGGYVTWQGKLTSE